MIIFKSRCDILLCRLIVCLVALTPGLGKASDKPSILERFELPRGGELATIPVAIAGRQYRFLLDTGADCTACDTSLQPLLGRPVARTWVTTLNGRIQTLRFSSSRMSIGKMPVKDGTPLLLADLTLMRQAADADIMGIVGMNILRGYTICFDFEGTELRFLTSANEVRGEPLPLLLKGGTPRVSGRVYGVGGVEFIIDTGCSGSPGTISSRVFADWQKRGALLDRGAAFMATINGSVESRSGLLRELALGPFQHNNLLFDEASDDTVLGLGYLRRYTVTFDFPRSMMYLAPNRAFNARDVRDMSGLHLLRIRGQATVHSVDAGSPSDRAGIRAGDTIITIGEVDASRARLVEIRNLLCVEGASISLKLGRAGGTVAVEFELNDWQRPTEPTPPVNRSGQ